MVDDSPEKLERNFGNHLRISPFLGDNADTELQDVLSYLKKVQHVENFRAIEKRGWKRG